jgi:hypothetical protein
MATPAPPKTAAAPAPAKRGGGSGLESKLSATQLANHTRACVAIHALVGCGTPECQLWLRVDLIGLATI